MTNHLGEWRRGFYKGIPIGIGYFFVSFTFGMMAVMSGLSPWLAVVISMTNLTSAGQFAGTNLILSGAGGIEITLTTFVINIRYMLMSLSLSQKIRKGTKRLSRLIFSFGVTDEVFAVAVSEQEELTGSYMFGLIAAPYLGWTVGTAFGAFASGFMSARVQNAMGIALYGMFIAIIVPPAKKSFPVLFTVLFSIALHLLMEWIPWFQAISSGFRIIFVTLLAAGIAAWLFPVKGKEECV